MEYMHCSRLLPPALSSGSIKDKEEIPETTEFTLSPLDDAPLARMQNMILLKAHRTAVECPTIRCSD